MFLSCSCLHIFLEGLHCGSSTECGEVDVRELREWLLKEGELLAPIDLSLSRSVAVSLPDLGRRHFGRTPARARITNNGWTVLLSGKWKETRPYIYGGPFSEKYVFWMLHFHWAENDCHGSEHSADGQEFPLEMHVVYFKARYFTYDEAVKHDDGVVFEVHFFYIQPDENSNMNTVVNNLSSITEAGCSTEVDKVALSTLFLPFANDYLMYAGKITAHKGEYKVIWLISRRPLGISHGQMIGFRTLRGKDGRSLLRNFHYLYDLGHRRIYHVNTTNYLVGTLYPYPKTFHKDDKLRIKFTKLSFTSVNKNELKDKKPLRKDKNMKNSSTSYENCNTLKNKAVGTEQKFKTKVTNTDIKNCKNFEFPKNNSDGINFLENKRIMSQNQDLYELFKSQTSESETSKSMNVKMKLNTVNIPGKKEETPNKNVLKNRKVLKDMSTVYEMRKIENKAINTNNNENTKSIGIQITETENKTSQDSIFSTITNVCAKCCKEIQIFQGNETKVERENEGDSWNSDRLLDVSSFALKGLRKKNNFQNINLKDELNASSTTLSSTLGRPQKKRQDTIIYEKSQCSYEKYTVKEDRNEIHRSNSSLLTEYQQYHNYYSEPMKKYPNECTRNINNSKNQRKRERETNAYIRPIKNKHKKLRRKHSTSLSSLNDSESFMKKRNMKDKNFIRANVLRDYSVDGSEEGFMGAWKKIIGKIKNFIQFFSEAETNSNVYCSNCKSLITETTEELNLTKKKPRTRNEIQSPKPIRRSREVNRNGEMSPYYCKLIPM